MFLPWKKRQKTDLAFFFKITIKMKTPGFSFFLRNSRLFPDFFSSLFNFLVFPVARHPDLDILFQFFDHCKYFFYAKNKLSDSSPLRMSKRVLADTSLATRLRPD